MEQDGFISRKLKQIFSQYFRPYLLPSPSTSASSIPNPFTVLLTPALVQEPSDDNMLVCTYGNLTLSLSLSLQ